MSYISAVNVIKAVAEAVNPSGIFVHGRTWDASLEFNGNETQIFLYPLQNTINQDNSYFETWQCVMGFYFQDAPDSTNEEREQLISNADILSRSFLSTIQLVENIEISQIRTEPKYRQMSGTYSGVIISFLLNTVTDLCNDGEIIIIPTVKTFCEKVDDCLGVNGNGDSNKYLNEKGEWVTVSGSSAVDSVNGKTGVVVLDKNDIGLGNADNTSDVNKPVSSATQTALNLKQDAIGYTPEDVANKTDVMSGNTASSIKYLSAKGVYDWVISLGYITASALSGYLTTATAALTYLTITTASTTYQLILTAANFGAFINGLTDKSVPAAGDYFLMSDSADSLNAKKILFSNLDSAIKTHYVVSKTFTGNTITGTTSESIVVSKLISGGTFQAYDIPAFSTSIQRTTNAGTYRVKIYINTANTLTGATQIYESANVAANVGSFNFQRGKSWFSSSTNLKAFGSLSTGPTDEGASLGSAPLDRTWDTANDMYMIVTIAPASSGDTFNLAHLVILNTR